MAHKPLTPFTGEWKSLLGKGERRAWLRAEYQPLTTDEEDSHQEGKFHYLSTRSTNLLRENPFI